MQYQRLIIFLVKKDLISVKTVLWYIVFTGFAVNYMTRVNLNIAIVSMVKHKPNKNLEAVSTECLGNASTSVISRNINESSVDNIIANTTTFDDTVIDTKEVSFSQNPSRHFFIRGICRISPINH